MHFLLLQLSVLMPLLWVTAFGMSYPQMYWKELQTITTKEYVITQGNIPLSDWIGHTAFVFEEERIINVQGFTPV